MVLSGGNGFAESNRPKSVMFQSEAISVRGCWCSRFPGFVLAVVAWLCCAHATLQAGPSDVSSASQRHYVTQVAQFRELSGADYLSGCDFHLKGVVTLVDRSRDLIVVQDASGAVALHFPLRPHNLEAGQLVALEGTHCCPYCSRFPDYPYHPTGSEIRPLFETPVNWGEYYLTRMRGWLRPPVTGKYSFWIASDNSSELWLSLDASPSKIRRIALIPRFMFVEPRDWSRIPSQHSESVELNAGETYYIEALQEQTTGLDNLSVAWQGPTLEQTVIDGNYLVPWNEGNSLKTNTGIFREYWTNYTLGGLIGMSGPRSYASALSVKEVGVTVLGPGQFPDPIPISLSQSWQPGDDFRWVAVEGTVKFSGVEDGIALLEISDGQTLAEVRASNWNSDLLKRLTNAVVRIEGVCEGVYDPKGILSPGLIWATATNSISILQATPANTSDWSLNQPAQTVLATNPAMEGFFATRGVVTFNDRVFGTDYTYLQEGAAALRVSLKDGRFKDSFKLGQWVEVGGALEPGPNIGAITPLAVVETGRHSMPSPIDQPLVRPVPGNRDGRWNEIEGIVHSVNSNGTLGVFENSGTVQIWIGNTPSNQLTRYIDAKVRARGVLSLDFPDAPVLLVPSRAYMDVEEPAPQDPFGVPRRRIADIQSENIELLRTHRVRVVGEVTWRDSQSFFVQDASGGIRVRSRDGFPAIGKGVEIVAFPMPGGTVRTLNDGILRAASLEAQAKPVELDLSREIPANQSGKLITATATLLSLKTNGPNRTLELQQQQRLFVATLAQGTENPPEISPGSLVRLTGVCDDETAGSPLNILLRSGADIAVLSGPMWWTWKNTAALIGTLLTVVFGALMWIYLLRRRLERQQAAQLAFSRQVLERVEEERRRIAANLHDSLGQVLLAIKNHALMAMQLNPNEQGLKDRLNEISGTTSQAIDEVRQITHGLRPYQLDRLGLTQAIRASINRPSENGSIVFATLVEDIDGLFDKESEIHVYRVVQEAVNNVLKHSGATEATVVIKERSGVVMLSIRDNGRGCDSANQSSTSHDAGFGLSGMAERVRILGGTMTIDSKPGEGTRLNVDVPLKRR